MMRRPECRRDWWSEPSFRTAWLAAVMTLSVSGVLAVDSTMTQGGFAGLSITPNAHLLSWGQFGATYDNQLPGISDPNGHNFVMGFGLLPNVKVVGRLAVSDLQSNCFTQSCGAARDMSASFKAGICLDAANRYRLAADATDLGGAATFFRSYYGVLTYNEGPVELSGGVAKRSGPGTNGSKSLLNRPFSAVAWQPLPLVRAQVE